MSVDDTKNQSEDGAVDKIKICKWRLSDSVTHELSKRSYPIDIPLRASVILWKPGKTFPGLGKILVALEDEYGRSSRKYDNYKQSFSFPFLIEMKVDHRVMHYVWNLWDYKGAVDFRFRRMIERPEDLPKKNDVISIDTEISEQEFEYLVGFLVGWIEGYVNARCKYVKTLQPFYRSIPASLTIYGFEEDAFYCTNFDESQAFDNRVDELKKKYPLQPEHIDRSIEWIADVKKHIEKAKRDPGS